MKKANSISLLVLGTGLLPIAAYVDYIYLKYSLLFTSIIINVIAVWMSFREKNNKL